MKDLFLENPIISVHNGKQGSAVEKFPPEKVILKIEEQKYRLHDLIKFIEKGPQALPESDSEPVHRFVQQFFGDTQKLEIFKFSDCRLIVLHTACSGKCRLEKGIEFSS